MAEIRVLAFDVGGTVFDWKGALVPAFASALKDAGLKGDPEQMAMQWRREMFIVLQKVRRKDIEHCGIDKVLDIALDDVLTDYPQLARNAEVRTALLDAWYGMKAWDEFPSALRRLRAKYTAMILSVLSFAMLVGCNKANGLDWDAIISCEFLGAYKIDPEAYLEGAALIGAKPEEICFVAAHPVDLKAAAATGMRTAYVAPKMGEPDIPGMNVPFDARDYDYVAATFSELCDLLGC